MIHPYRGLPSFQFWNSGVTHSAPGSLDPMVAAKFQIKASDRVATMGSCFAQHISRHLLQRGLQYFVAESGDPSLSAEKQIERNYGVFSARYGNVYTTRQAVQLFDRAFGLFNPSETSWEIEGGGFVDPFRPQIEPTPWATIEEVVKSRDEHLSSVRRVFLESDILVFTLGLTEAFVSADDGAVYPVAPGVSGGSYASDRYMFVNYGVDQVMRDLDELISKVREVNPESRFILTVSPVPLIATFEPRHVLVSTTISKATLRVAANEITKRYDFVEYFPSYEIISGSAAGAKYFENDLREVSQVGVNHVMRIFEKHMLQGSDRFSGLVSDSSLHDRSVVCDEETIVATMKSSGLVNPSIGPINNVRNKKEILRKDDFSRTAFGQFGEDLVIEAILQTHGRIQQGNYVDVGAFHPLNYSNTALLYEKYGWSGMNIDANKGAIDEFQLVRPSDINLIALVGENQSEREYVYFNHPGVNSADQKMIDRQTRDSSPFKEISRETRFSQPLSELLDHHFESNRKVDFLSVDAEGMDLEVLNSNNWAKYRPFLIAVETHGMDLDRPDENDIYIYLSGLGYKMVSQVFVTSMFIDMRS